MALSYFKATTATGIRQPIAQIMRPMRRLRRQLLSVLSGSYQIGQSDSAIFAPTITRNTQATIAATVTMPKILTSLLLAVLIWVGVEVALTLQTTRATEAAVPVMITAQLAPIRVAAVAKINAVKLPDVQPMLDAAKAKISAVKLPDVQPTVDAAQALLATANTTVAAATPLLVTANATVQDAKESWDDMYDDVSTLVSNAEVAAHGVGVMADVVAQASPKMVQQAEKGEEQLTGIATDVHTVTTQIAKPKSFMGKLWEGIKSLAGLARFI